TNTNHSQVIHTPLQPTDGSNQHDQIINQILSTEIVINTQPSIQLSETNTIATQVPSVSSHRANVVPPRRQPDNHTAQTRQNQRIPQQYWTLPRQQLQTAHHYHQQQQHRQHLNQVQRQQPQRQRFDPRRRQQQNQHRFQQQRRAETDQQHSRPWRDYSYERPSDLFYRIMQEVFVEQNYQRLLEEYLNPPLPSDLHDLPVVEENPDILFEAYESGKMDEKLQWEQEQLQQLELEASIEPQLLDQDELEQTENIDSINRTLEEEQNTHNLQQLTSKQLL
ncbi:unnamed protein product, partial [Rotaria sp. Silwood2]